MTKQTKIFVAMPFKDELDNVFFVIEQYGKEKGYDVWRADKNLTSDTILSHILEKIDETDVVIADVTYSNPNVFLEIGYSWAIGKETLLIADNLDELPFDIRGISVFPYGDRRSAKKIKEALCKHIDAAVNKTASSSNVTHEIIKIAKSLSSVNDQDSLYYRLVESHVNRTKNHISSWLNGRIEVNRNDLIAKGLEIFEKIESGGFATFLAPIEGYWEANNEYTEKSREIAKDKERNLNIKRVYILHNIDAIISDVLLENIRKDEEAGISTHVAFKGKLNNDEIKDFGIWDDEVVCIIDTAENQEGVFEVVNGAFTNRKDEIEKFNGYKRSIINHSIRGKEIISEIENMTDQKKLLLKSVFVMEKLSKGHCQGGYLSDKENNCSWYHAAWQYLRLVDLVSTPSLHGNFYSTNLDAHLSCQKESRILISGTADYGILRQVLSVNNLQNIDEILIIDSCSTPLEIAKKYASEFHNSSPKINDLCKDIMKSRLGDGTYDVIITDAFLTRFNPSERKMVVQEWKRILSKDGVIITTARIEERNQPYLTPIKSSKSDVNRFVSKARLRVEKSGKLLKQIEHKIISHARIYAENITSYPFINEQEIKDLFSGFNLSIEKNTVKGEINENTTYCLLVATPCISN